MLDRYTPATFGREVLLILLAILFALPVYLLVITALKSPGEATASPLSFPTDAQVSNFSTAWNDSQEIGGASLAAGLVNSVIITGLSILGMIVLGALAAYFIARATSRLSGVVFALFLAGLILPAQLSLIPVVVVLRQLELDGTHLGVVCFYVGFFLPIAVLLFAGFIRRIPTDFEESALVDGVGRTRIFFSIVFPLLRPVTVTVAILAGLAVWNDFFTPLVLLSGSDNATLPVAVYSFVGQYTTNWSLVFSAVLIALAPVVVLYLLAQRHIVEGLSGGVRG